MNPKHSARSRGAVPPAPDDHLRKHRPDVSSSRDGQIDR
jgi:hypothetical protein